MEAGPTAQPRNERYEEPRPRRDYDDDHRHGSHHRRKKKGFLGEVFDFD